MSKENKEEVRDKTDDIVEKRKLGKLGMKEQPLIGQILSPVETTRFFLPLSIVLCKGVDTSHGNANNSRLGEDGEIGEVFEEQTQGSVVLQISRNAVRQLETFSDTDWAGCRRTRRSTTGGYTVAGSHLIKMWCKTQAVVALSSAEAELYGLVRASAETLGLVSMYKDLGTHMNGVVLGDASAALAIVARRGLGAISPWL